jgi:maltose alpha-D-glucosyltransferase / alpha-amylase
VRFWSTSALVPIEVPTDAEVRPLGVEQSNSSVKVGDDIIFKAYRRLAPGIQPEIEIGRFLVEEAGYTNTPPLLGAIERIGADGEITAYGAAFGFVRNQGDGWVYTIEYLERRLGELRLEAASREDHGEPPLGDDVHGIYLDQAATLGRRTAELHRAFATPSDDPAFRPEPITPDDIAAWGEGVRRQAAAALSAVEQALAQLTDPGVRDAAESFLARRPEIEQRIASLVEGPVEALKTRLHGDYHLGQVLVVQNDFYILDFEGEPARPLAERRVKMSPFKDVAGMLRSFDYAGWSAEARLLAIDAARPETVQALAGQWQRATEAAFLDAYREAIAGCESWPADEAQAERLMALFLLEKALYEIGYEAANRPAWLHIPIRGVLGLIPSNEHGETSDGTG